MLSPRHCLVALVALVLLAACSQAPRVQGDSKEQIDVSLAALAVTLQGEDAVRMNQAITRLGEVASLSDEERLGLPNPYDLVPGRTAPEFIRLMDKYAPPAATAQEDSFPNGVLATRMLRLYELQRTILREARQDALLAGRSVIDQFPITDLQFIPPVSGSGIDRDAATFRVSLLNNTRFDIYRPAFRVVVKDRAGEVLFERLFEQARDKEPIGPGEVKASNLECCQILRDAYHNTMMRTLPAGATISASLVNVEDHSGRPVLETVAFTESDNARLHFLEACIAYLTPRLESWVPPEDGNECLTQAALDEWEMAQRQAAMDESRTAALN